MGGNPFYTNAEAYAFEILQQKLLKEAQRTAQQTVMELSALKTLFNQGQFLFCIPFGGTGLCPTNPFPLHPVLPSVCQPDPPPFIPPEPPHHHPCPQPAVQNAPTFQQASPSPPQDQQSNIHVNLKNGQTKIAGIKPGSDKCNLGDVGIEVTIDLREYLPAEISLDVDEKSVEIKACHVEPQGSKTFARRYDLPACILLDTVKCILSHDGYLLFSAAWLKME